MIILNRVLQFFRNIILNLHDTDLSLYDGYMIRLALDWELNGMGHMGERSC